MINNRFQYYKTYSLFRQRFNNKLIPADAIAFVEDAQIIATHNVQFGKDRLSASDTGETVSI